MSFYLFIYLFPDTDVIMPLVQICYITHSFL